MLLNHTPRKNGDTATETQMQMLLSTSDLEQIFQGDRFPQRNCGHDQKQSTRPSLRNDGVKTPKPVVSFEETPQGFVVNKTNFTALALMLGEDTNDWTGAKVALYPSRVDFKGKTMPTIKVRRPQKVAAATASGGHPFNDDVQF